MLTATEARKASVQGMFLNPSTKRSEGGNPTAKTPPTISQNQGMTILSLDERRPVVTFEIHGEAAHHRQHDRAAAIPRVPDRADRRLPGRIARFPPLVARR